MISSCKRTLEIDPPVNSITTTETFADSSTSTSAVLAIYAAFRQSTGQIHFGNGAITFYCGSSSDELVPFNSVGDKNQFYANNLTYANGDLYQLFWIYAYSFLYQENACLEGLTASKSITTSLRRQLIGEVKFLRAFTYFYLINLFGDVPYVTSSNWETNKLIARSSARDIYPKLISDLIDAKNSLRSDFSMSGNERTRATTWAASALLARIYLYLGQWSDANKEASLIIDGSSGLFQLSSNLDSVFLANSSEAILQWQQNSSYFPYNLTPEGFYNLPYGPTSPPQQYSISDELLKAFEPSDDRRIRWIDSSVYGGATYYYPYKYKVGIPDYNPNVTAPEYYMVIRLAEIYLIRAEARANGAGGGATAAVDDLNFVRLRANLPKYQGPTNTDNLLSAILHERQIELFAEWGHRWFDLKRTKNIDAVMNEVTPLKNGGGQWKSTQQLYPIPQSELSADPNLTQNSGY